MLGCSTFFMYPRKRSTNVGNLQNVDKTYQDLKNPTKTFFQTQIILENVGQSQQTQSNPRKLRSFTTFPRISLRFLGSLQVCQDCSTLSRVALSCLGFPGNKFSHGLCVESKQHHIDILCVDPTSIGRWIDAHDVNMISF